MALAHAEAARKLYKSRAWLKCRESYIAKVFGLCERCQSPGKIVHHKTHLNSHNINDPDVTLNHSNLELLCQTCHNKEHFERYSPVVEGLKFDNEGNLVQA